MSKAASLIADATLKSLYAKMLQSRLLQKHLQEGHQLPSSGDSVAAFVAGAIDLHQGDWIAPPGGSPLPAYAAGVSIDEILSGLTYRARPSRPGGALSSVCSQVPFASTFKEQASLANGVALALREHNRGKVVVAFLSKAGGRLDSWHESVDYAGSQSLPVLFFTERDIFREKKTLSKKSRPQATSSRAGMVPVIPVDGGDIVALYRVAYESLHKARYGGGPTVIEAVVNSARRGKAAGAPTLPRVDDPLLKMEEYLTAKGLFSLTWKQRLTENFADSLANAQRSVRNQQI